MTQAIHVPVLCTEVLKYAEIAEGEVWLDGTAGGGGHTTLLAERVGSQGRVIALDRDPEAATRLSHLPENVHVFCLSYHRAKLALDELKVSHVDGILLDLGLSSDQLEDRERGFSFQSSGELDMRFNREEGQPVWQWLQHVDEKTLADTIYQFGEERFSRRIARRIVEVRKSAPVRTADQLREIIRRSVPAGRRTTSGSRKHGRVDPATRTFQALRIAINSELEIVEKALGDLPNLLSNHGRILAISFHSLEDRLVKHAFREDPRLEVVTRKPVQATEAEVLTNPRARSAKLRVAKRSTVESLSYLSP